MPWWPWEFKRYKTFAFHRSRSSRSSFVLSLYTVFILVPFSRSITSLAIYIQCSYSHPEYSCKYFLYLPHVQYSVQTPIQSHIQYSALRLLLSPGVQLIINCITKSVSLPTVYYLFKKNHVTNNNDIDCFNFLKLSSEKKIVTELSYVLLFIITVIAIIITVIF